MADYVDDDFEWDEDKSDLTYRRRGFDFGFASRLFDQPRYLEAIEDSADYGEERVKSWGTVDGIFITVIWTHVDGGRKARKPGGEYSVKQDFSARSR